MNMQNLLEFIAKLEAFDPKETWTIFDLFPKLSVALGSKSLGAVVYLLDD